MIWNYQTMGKNSKFSTHVPYFEWFHLNLELWAYPNYGINMTQN